jgi:hypothetical protein
LGNLVESENGFKKSENIIYHVFGKNHIKYAEFLVSLSDF